MLSRASAHQCIRAHQHASTPAYGLLTHALPDVLYDDIYIVFMQQAEAQIVDRLKSFPGPSDEIPQGDNRMDKIQGVWEVSIMLAEVLWHGVGRYDVAGVEPARCGMEWDDSKWRSCNARATQQYDDGNTKGNRL